MRLRVLAPIGPVIQVCVRVCVCVCVCVCLFVSMCVFLGVRALNFYTRNDNGVRMCLCVCVGAYVPMCVYMCVFVYMHQIFIQEAMSADAQAVQA